MPEAPAKGARAVHTLEWTDDERANRLISEDPNALLIGFCLDQQVPVQKAFRGPLAIRERLGTLDPASLARLDPARVAAAFSTPPAIHRFPSSMARRVQALCDVIAREYGGDGSRMWREARDGEDLRRRLAALPGFGAGKAASLVAVAGNHFGVRPPGWERVRPSHRTLGDVTTAGELHAYQAGKRAQKAAMRRAAGNGGRR